jgi:hypothetical protein
MKNGRIDEQTDGRTERQTGRHTDRHIADRQNKRRMD